MNFIKKTLRNVPLYLRHNKFKKVKVKNEDVTILCNCCIGGVMYNDLGLRFLSPTINLFFSHNSFINWVKNIREYQTAEFVDTGRFDINENGLHGPVCKLVKEGLPEIEIHFLHYDSFEQAKKKWFERYERINYSKIFLVIEAQAEHEHSLIDEYAALPYKKVIFTNLPAEPDRSIVHLSFYDKYKASEKSVTGFTSVFGSRGYDEYDFVNEIFNADY